MEYTIIFLRNVLKKNLPDLPKTIRSRVVDAIHDRLTVDPLNLGKPLHHSFKGHRRLRVSDYRIIYSVNTVKHAVTIVAVGHRDTIYEEALKIIDTYTLQ
ncbi:type II toxin-antitoxin system RelE/ParE family toxin [Wolbachia endosymbiont of Drosophila malagassya]|uniref:type II toxin-antitoxin system RelE family toxin n=1 Tax=Wolbachia TaxID=953 RepID=UPI00110677B4|nr:MULTISPECIES: type II toxin-antitoxin system RelE/ParE family toxin [Wolbachia]MDU8941278.1 type II toxin-antitoxin system RelE/ParE family toxin [Wolbachia endosymbiont of Drosophila malagassya]MBA8753185.1 type II toxin-antitoxin system RelE/ParE family toxin [Wolbachia pipientis]MDE5064307.1 type II toxin-antitoxin system RelE/ParE family toxin [Wolbachia endosymbiont of Drosophila tristis]MDE5065495.1 type II toxin-antitoxin system RelE/ParE family toxin [Wolbachia endosymbiont of Drosop